MNKKQIKYIINNHYKKLKKYIKKIVGIFNVEDIHQFRLQYKKLRAFLRMISQEQKATDKIKIYKPLIKGYNILGTIRDLQLQQQRILEVTKEELNKPKAYLLMLQKKIDKLQPELYKIFLKNPVNISKKKTDSVIRDKFLAKSFRNFVRQKWTNVYAIVVSGEFSDANIHAIRKNLKDMFYNIEIYEELKHELFSLSAWKEKDKQYFDKILDELGSFHDKCTAIALLKFHRLNNLNIYDRELLERIKKEWIEDKIRMKKSLVEVLKADIAFQQDKINKVIHKKSQS